MTELISPLSHRKLSCNMMTLFKREKYVLVGSLQKFQMKTCAVKVRLVFGELLLNVNSTILRGHFGE